MSRIEEWLCKTIGLDAASVGCGMVRRAVRQRLKSLGLKRAEDYLEVLNCSRAESQELIEAVVVTETWFFRDPEPHALLVDRVREQRMPDRHNLPWRILSIPCASGEEPFSLAMALQDSGMPPHHYRIDAADISSRALHRAARGVYAKNSFRGRNLVFRTRYFQASAEGFVLDQAIRDRVHFYQGNFLSDQFLPARGSYHFIFCRNLLIYLDPEGRRKALRKLEQLLTPSGMLFVGPVEQPLASDYGFRIDGSNLAFACCKSEPGTRGHRSSRVSKRLRNPARGQRLTSGRAPDTVRHSPQHQLDTVQHLIDGGHIEEAASLCEAHLRVSRTSAQGHYLLGLLREAGGRSDAIECYRRALYLKPDYYECLLRMALLLQAGGDAARAHLFRARAARAKMKM